MNSRKVNLFVVGAMKAGTTAFTEVLSKHPDIYFSLVKEPNYFINEMPQSLYEESRFFSLEDYLNKEYPEPLHIARFSEESNYHKLFSLAKDEEYLAEGSTTYLHTEESASLIHQYNPDARIIILLRDPLERAFSHYKMDRGLGREISSFNSIMNKEIRRYQEGSLTWYSYLGMSLYTDAVKRYTSLFKDVLVIDFNDLIHNKERTFSETSKFLKLDEFDNLEVTDRINESKKIRFYTLYYILKRIGIKDYFSYFFKNSFKQSVFRMISTNKGKYKMNLSSENRLKLEAIFKKKSSL